MTDSLFERSWDVIVVGTGIGGGVLGRALVEKGLSVLFIEKGLPGWRTEESTLSPTLDDPVARLLRGAWPDPIEVRQDGMERQFFAPLGCGVGGTSVFYAATLEQPAQHEFTSDWPVSYGGMAAWYDAAKALFEIQEDQSAGGEATLTRVPAMNSVDAAIMTRLQSNGLNPYRLRIAIRHLPHCAECLGRKCPRDCKRDGRSTGIEPALASGRAGLAVGCEVVRLVGTTDRVTGVEIRRGNQTFVLSAPRVVLAAGALSTPRILMASTSDAWPDGCGNGTGLVGRNLMLHLNEIFAIWPGVRENGPTAGGSKAIGLRDLMLLEDGRHLGAIQSLGVVVREGEILHALRESLSQSRLGRTRLVREGTRIPAKIAAKALGAARLFVGLLEDLPDPANRVVFDPAQPGRIRLEYHIPDELRVRRTLFRRSIRSAFRGLKPLFLNYRPEPNWGHPCGTTRMGISPATSVVDAFGRVHGIANLWISDAGVFPTSFGVNPSLTIAANALRVADGISRTSPT